MRGVVDPELRVVENVERFGAEFEIALAKHFEVFQQRNIKIRARGIVERVAPAVSKRQAARRHAELSLKLRIATQANAA